MNAKSPFFTELKRCKVFKIGAAHAELGWLPTSRAMYRWPIGCSGLSIERFARFAQQVPYIARHIAGAKHYAALHCESGLVEVLRTLEGEDPHLAQACPEAGAP